MLEPIYYRVAVKDRSKPWVVCLYQLSNGLYMLEIRWRNGPVAPQHRIPLYGMHRESDARKAVDDLFRLLHRNLDPWLYTGAIDPVKERKYRAKKKPPASS